MDRISDSGSDDVGSTPAGNTWKGLGEIRGFFVGFATWNAVKKYRKSMLMVNYIIFSLLAVSVVLTM